MTTCKIASCQTEVYEAGLCGGCYASWLATGTLPGEIKPKRGAAVSSLSQNTTPRAYRWERYQDAAERLARVARKWAAHDARLADALQAYDEVSG